MAEHFRSFLDETDHWANPILHPDSDLVHRLLVNHGARILEVLGATRLADTDSGQRWRFDSETNHAVIEVYEPDIVIPAFLRRGDLGLFYTRTGDAGPLWGPVPEQTTIPQDVDSGNPVTDSLVIFGETLFASAKRVHESAHLAATLMAPIRDPIARRQWQMSTTRTKGQIATHYDLSPEVYTGQYGFLDKYVQYSSGLLPPDSEFTSLENLQEAKIESLSKKLALDKAETLLEVGGGWGGLAVALASMHPNLHITSLTISDEQLVRAQQRASEAGVDNRVEFLGKDYRDLEVNDPFDRVVSVEMIEAVDWRDLDVYLQSLIDFVDPVKGIVVLQSINIGPEHYARQKHHSGFTSTAIFPGGIVTPKEVISSKMRTRGWRTHEETDLTNSYALTLREWIANLSANESGLTKVFEAKGIPREKIERFYRGFKLYLAMSETVFRNEVGYLSDTQQVFVPQ